MKLKHFAAAVALGAVAAPAFAIPLDSIGGPVQWKITGVTTEYVDGEDLSQPGPQGLHYGTNESTWGVGTVNTLIQFGSNIWNAGEGGQYLNYMLYGIHDLSQSSGGPNGVNIYNDGATGGAANGRIHLDIYLSSSQFQLSTASLANRSSFNTYDGLTDTGSLYLSLEFATGGIDDDLATGPNENLLAQLFQNVTANTLPANGNGFFYAYITGGSAAAQWNTNGFLGGGADFNGVFTLQDSAGPTVQLPNAAEFPGFVADPISSRADAPEPATLALLGLGLAGLALRRRRLVA